MATGKTLIYGCLRTVVVTKHGEVAESRRSRQTRNQAH